MKILAKIANLLNNSQHNNLSARDKRQILTMLAVVILIFAFNALTDLTKENKAPKLDAETEAKLALLDQRLSELQAGDTLSRLDRYIVDRYDTLQLFYFDPNTVTKEQMLQLGFTEKQASNLANYRENGGRFSKPDDLRKLYGMRTMQFKILKPYIAIAGHNNDKHSPKKDTEISRPADQKTETPKNIFDFDPNTITADEFARLGFTEKQAEQFVNWRKSGKTFYTAKDLQSTSFIDSKRYRELEPYIKIDLAKLFGGKQMLDLNTASAAEMRDLGIKAEEAASIIDFREKIGYYYANWQIEDVIRPKQRANELKEKFYVCASVELRKIDFNTIEIDALQNNPYFSRTQISAIATLRESQKITSVDDLRQTKQFTEKELKRIKRYMAD